MSDAHKQYLGHQEEYDQDYQLYLLEKRGALAVKDPGELEMEEWIHKLGFTTMKNIYWDHRDRIGRRLIDYRFSQPVTQRPCKNTKGRRARVAYSINGSEDQLKTHNSSIMQGHKSTDSPGPKDSSCLGGPSRASAGDDLDSQLENESFLNNLKSKQDAKLKQMQEDMEAQKRAKAEAA